MPNIDEILRFAAKARGGNFMTPAPSRATDASTGAASHIDEALKLVAHMGNNDKGKTDMTKKKTPEARRRTRLRLGRQDDELKALSGVMPTISEIMDRGGKRRRKFDTRAIRAAELELRRLECLRDTATRGDVPEGFVQFRERTAHGRSTVAVRPLVKLPDSGKWTNRFEVRSESSDRVYVISQHKTGGHWGCSCPGWARHRTCKHIAGRVPSPPREVIAPSPSPTMAFVGGMLEKTLELLADITSPRPAPRW